MNIEIANRLYELRKQNNLSQEELAERIGVSRQAVSKWERAESSPDTDNLIALARMYGVSLDTLLNTSEPIPNFTAEKPNDEPTSPLDNEGKHDEEDFAFNSGGFHIKDKNGDEVKIGLGGIHVRSKNGDEVKITGGIHVNGNRVRHRVNVNEQNGDEINIGPDGIHVNGNKVRHNGDKVNIHINNANINEDNCNVHIKIEPTLRQRLNRVPVPFIVIIAYIVMGVVWNLWHPGWLIFFAIPLYYTLVNRIPVFFITAVAYIVIGVLWNLWHPGWLIFFAIPLYYALVNMIKSKGIHKKLQAFPMAIICTTLFLYLGLCHSLWHPTWVILLAIPLYHCIVDAVFKS